MAGSTNGPVATGTAPQPTTRKVRRKRFKLTVGGVQAIGGQHKPGRQFTPKGQPVGGQKSGNGKGGDGKGGKGSSGPPTPEGGVYNLGAQLNDPETVKQLVSSLIRGQYGPAIREAKQDLARTPQYFEDYRARLAQVQRAQQDMYGQTLGQLGQFAQQAGQGAAQAIQVGNAAQAQGAQVTGAVPSGQVGADAAAAAQVRQGMLGGQAGVLANQAQLQSNYLANRSAASVPLQMQAEQDARGRLSDVRQQRGGARAEMLSALRQELRDRLESDRDFRLVAQEFGLDKANLQADIANDKRDDKLAAKKLKLDAIEHAQDLAAANRAERRDLNTWGYTNAEWRAKSESERQAIIKAQKNYADAGEGGGSGGGDGDHQEGIKLRRDIASLYRQYAPKIGTTQMVFNEATKKNEPHVITEQDVLNRIEEKTSYSTNEIRLVSLMAQGRALTSADKRLAKSLGIPLPLKIRRPTHTAHKDPKDRPGGQGH